MITRTTGISDFGPAEMEAFEYSVRQNLGFLNANENQTAKTKFLGSIHAVAAQTIRDRCQWEAPADGNDHRNPGPFLPTFSHGCLAQMTQGNLLRVLEAKKLWAPSRP